MCMCLSRLSRKLPSAIGWIPHIQSDCIVSFTHRTHRGRLKQTTFEVRQPPVSTHKRTHHKHLEWCFAIAHATSVLSQHHEVSHSSALDGGWQSGRLLEGAMRKCCSSVGGNWERRKKLSYCYCVSINFIIYWCLCSLHWYALVCGMDGDEEKETAQLELALKTGKLDQEMCSRSSSSNLSSCGDKHIV